MKILDFEVGLDKPFFLIAGPCVIENEKLCLDVAEKMHAITEPLGIPYIFKASFDKANRSSLGNYRGTGLEEGLRILEKVRNEIGVPVLTDVHEKSQAKPVAEVVDMLQTPAFLCRQTDFIQEVAGQGKPVNIKKGQFLSPQEMSNVIQKARVTGNDKIFACERGYMFGYNNLVVDPRSFAIMRQDNCPVVADVTHSVQHPGGKGTASGGDRHFIPVFARTAIAVGVTGLFMETHPDPDKALSDGPNMWPLHKMEELLKILKDLDTLTKQKVDFSSGY